MFLVQARIERLLEDFDRNPMATSRALRELFHRNPASFRQAMPAVLRPQGASAGRDYLIALLTRQNLLIDFLSDPLLFTNEEAISIVRTAVGTPPRLDFQLAQCLNESIDAAGDRQSVKRLVRVLGIVADACGCARILPVLARLLGHPDPCVQSKAALLIGRANRSARWVGAKLAEGDPRIRANAIEALWGVQDESCRMVMHEATRDRDNRTAANALVGLYRLGDPFCMAKLAEMADHASAPFRASAAWAMGETGDSRFVPVLSKMLTDEPAVRRNAMKAAVRLRQIEEGRASKTQARVIISRLEDTERGKRRIEFVAMSGQPESFVKLAPVNVNIAEGDNLIFDYALQEFSSNTPLVIGIASPHIAAATDTLRREIESGLLRGLAVKRPHDVWCIRRYSTSEGREGGGAPAKADAAADAPSRLLVDPKAIETAIQTMGSSADAARDFTSAVSNLIDDVRTARGDRHVVALAASPPPPGSGAELAATARKRGVVVHCVGPRCGELTELTCGSGGVFVSSDHPSAVEVLCLRLISRYEVTYRFASQNGSDVTLQITTPTAAGDASTSTSNHPFPIAS